MANFNININNNISANIVGGDKIINSGESILLDPVTESYSNLGTLNFWELTNIGNTGSVSNIDILNNGINSAFTAIGFGTVIIQLEVRDDDSPVNTAFTTITITII